MATDYVTARELMLASVLANGTDVYVALWDGDPIDGGTELTLTGYARVAHSSWSTTSGPGTSARSNSGVVAFPTITDAGQVTHWSIHDAAVEPSEILYGAAVLDNLGQPFPIVLSGGGDDLQFPIGALRIELVN